MLFYNIISEFVIVWLYPIIIPYYRYVLELYLHVFIYTQCTNTYIYRQIKSRQAHMQMFWNQIKQINITLLATMECQHAYVSWPLDMYNAYMQYILYMLWLCVYAYKNTHIYIHTDVHMYTHVHTQSYSYTDCMQYHM